MWIYPVDMKRANEFGQIFEKEKDEDPEIDEPEIKPLTENSETQSATQAAKRKVKTAVKTE